jgi:hypothetical protein
MGRLAHRGRPEIEPVWLPIARSAASSRARHYHRVRARISNAVAVCRATAIALDSDLATSDGDLATVARLLGVEVIPLPDSTGRLP